MSPWSGVRHPPGMWLCLPTRPPPEPYAVGTARRPDPRAPPSLVPSPLWRMGMGWRCKLQGSHPGSVFLATSLHPGATQSHLIRIKGAPGALVTWEFTRSPTSGARDRYQHTCFLRPHTWPCWVNWDEGNMFLSPGESSAGRSPARPPLGGPAGGTVTAEEGPGGKHPEACQPGEAEEVRAGPGSEGGAAREAGSGVRVPEYSGGMA